MQPRGVVLVEGTSDRLAVETLARRRGRDLHAEDIAVVPMGGYGNLPRVLAQYVDLPIVGLYDAGEERHFLRALGCSDRDELERAGFYACTRDLEDELTRAVGPEGVERVLAEQGELRAFRTYQKQPAHRDRPLDEQLHGFMWNRKQRYAVLLVEALDLDRVPRPLDRVLAATADAGSRSRRRPYSLARMPVPEAPLNDAEVGRYPAGEGWFVLNAADGVWGGMGDSAAFGSACVFESPMAWFAQVGIKLAVLQPGQPNGMYHSESQQEDFLVLFGECRLLVEGEERALRPWDFFHCPAGTEHIFVGAGEGPCVIFMCGARTPDEKLHYPVSEPAARYGASVREETDDPDQAYAGYGDITFGRPPGWEQLPWSSA